MKRGILLIGGLLSLFTLASCNEETKVEYRDKIVEVEKPVEVIKEVEVTKEVPVETTVYVDREVVVEKEVEKTVTVEVPVEKIVEVEKIIEKEIPVEVEKVVTKTITVEVPVEKVVEVEKIIEKPVYIEKEVIVEKEVEVPVEVEKIVYVDRPVEVEKIVEKEVTVEVPVEKIVEVEKVIEKEIPVEVETIVNNYIEVEVPIEKIVEVEKIVEKEVIVERDNSYLDRALIALRNAIYCSDNSYNLYKWYNEGTIIPYMAVYKRGKTGTKNSIDECHANGLGVSYMASASYAIANGSNDTTYLKHTQLPCIKRENGIDYTQYLNQPITISHSFYHGEYHDDPVYGPDETYQDTLSDELGLHILTNVKVECWSNKNGINYNSIPVNRYVLSYDEDFSFGEFYGGILEEIRLQDRKIELSDYYHYDTKLEVDDEVTVLGSAIKVKYLDVAYKSGITNYYNCKAQVTVGEDNITVAEWTAKLNSGGGYEWEGNKLVTIRLTEEGVGEIINIQDYYDFKDYGYYLKK